MPEPVQLSSEQWGKEGFIITLEASTAAGAHWFALETGRANGAGLTADTVSQSCCVKGIVLGNGTPTKDMHN